MEDFYTRVFRGNYTTSNTTTQVTTPENTSALVLLILLSIFTVVSNGLVLISIAIERRLRTVFNCFIVNLAVGDLLVGAVVVPLFAVYKYLGRWPLDKGACVFWLAVDYITCNVSLLTLCVISFDRCLGIHSPLRCLKVRSKRRRAVVCGNVAVWLVVAAFWVPGVPLTYIDDPDMCEQDMVTHRTYGIITAVLCYYVPSGFLIVCQVLMLIRLKGTVKKKAFLTASHHSHARSGKRTKQNGNNHSTEVKRTDSDSSVESTAGCDFSPVSVKKNIRTGRCDVNMTASGSSTTIETSVESLPEVSRRVSYDFSPASVRKNIRAERSDVNTNTGSSTTIETSVESLPEISSRISGVPNSSMQCRRGTDSGSSPLAVRLGIAAVMKAVEEQNGPSRARGLTFPLDDLERPGGDGRTRNRSLDNDKLYSETKTPKASSLTDLFSSIRKTTTTTHSRHTDGMCKRERAAIRTVIVITVALLISWLPWYVVYMCLAFNPDGIPPAVYDTASWMAYGNSAVNPILYGYLNKDFRLVFKRIVRLGKGGRFSQPGSPNWSPAGTPRVTPRRQGTEGDTV